MTQRLTALPDPRTLSVVAFVCCLHMVLKPENSFKGAMIYVNTQTQEKQTKKHNCLWVY